MQGGLAGVGPASHFQLEGTLNADAIEAHKGMGFETRGWAFDFRTGASREVEHGSENESRRTSPYEHGRDRRVTISRVQRAFGACRT